MQNLLIKLKTIIDKAHKIKKILKQYDIIQNIKRADSSNAKLIQLSLNLQFVTSKF
jgi:hypothetical protein